MDANTTATKPCYLKKKKRKKIYNYCNPAIFNYYILHIHIILHVSHNIRIFTHTYTYSYALSATAMHYNNTSLIITSYLLSRANYVTYSYLQTSEGVNQTSDGELRSNVSLRRAAALQHHPSIKEYRHLGFLF